MSLAQIAAALREVSQNPDRPPGVFTTGEYATATGLNYDYAGKLIGRAVDDGVLEYVGKIPVRKRTGKIYPTGAYRLRTSKR